MTERVGDDAGCRDGRPGREVATREGGCDFSMSEPWLMSVTRSFGRSAGEAWGGSSSRPASDCTRLALKYCDGTPWEKSAWSVRQRSWGA